MPLVHNLDTSSAACAALAMHAAVARRLWRLVGRYPGLRVSDRASVATVTDADRETVRWLSLLFVAIIFAFPSIAVVNTLT